MRLAVITLVFLVACSVVAAAQDQRPDTVVGSYPRTSPQEPLATALSLKRRPNSSSPWPWNGRGSEVRHLPHNYPYLMARPALKELSRRRWPRSASSSRAGWLTGTIGTRKPSPAGTPRSWRRPRPWQSMTRPRPGRFTPSLAARSTGCGRSRSPMAAGIGSSATGRRTSTMTTTGRSSRPSARATRPATMPAAESARARSGPAADLLPSNPPPDLHHQTMLLWASTKLDGLMDVARKERPSPEASRLAAERRRLEPAIAGPLETPRRHGQRPRRPQRRLRNRPGGFRAPPSGGSGHDPAIMRGVAWLKANQRARDAGSPGRSAMTRPTTSPMREPALP